MGKTMNDRFDILSKAGMRNFNVIIASDEGVV